MKNSKKASKVEHLYSAHAPNILVRRVSITKFGSICYLSQPCRS